MSAPNVLLLDEPTNDLDIETLKILEDYLDDFSGAVITVSHDRYFLDRVCRRIFAYEGNGKVREYTGNYSDYLIFLEANKIEKNDNTETIEKPKKETEKNSGKNNEKKLKFSYKEQLEFDSIEDEIGKIEEKLEKLEEAMGENASDYSKLQKL